MAVRKYQARVEPDGGLTIRETECVPGSEVEVFIFDQVPVDREELAARWEALARRVAEEQDVSTWTDEAIQAEVDAYRRGE